MKAYSYNKRTRRSSQPATLHSKNTLVAVVTIVFCSVPFLFVLFSITMQAIELLSKVWKH